MRARKLLVSSPRHLRPEQEAEVERLHRLALAVKQTVESSVNKDKRERVEWEALVLVTVKRLFVYLLQACYPVFQSMDLGYAWSAAITKYYVTHLVWLSL
jgi:hypothetical protein